MSTVTMTITGTDAGADNIEMKCEHGTTAEPIDPPASGEAMTDGIDRVQANHRRDTGCDCDRLVAVLDGMERLLH